jgi:hypothetical protein
MDLSFLQSKLVLRHSHFLQFVALAVVVVQGSFSPFLTAVIIPMSVFTIIVGHPLGGGGGCSHQAKRLYLHVLLVYSCAMETLLPPFPLDCCCCCHQHYFANFNMGIMAAMSLTKKVYHSVAT